MHHKSLLISLITLLLVSSVQIESTKAQTIEILGGNALNGAMTGTILGGATMALNNSNEFAPLRVGLGAGTLYGIAVGVYDISQVSLGQQYYVSGMFNDGDNSTIIVLLDTFYGAAGGAIVATSFNLITNEPLDKGLQYGAGIGAWAGFGFGLIDAFLLADRAGDFQSASSANGTSSGGVFTYSNQESGYNINLLSPAIHTQPEISPQSITVETTAAVNLVTLNVSL